MSRPPPVYRLPLDCAYLYGGGSAASNLFPWPSHCDYMPMCQYVPIVPCQPTLIYPYDQLLYPHANLLSLRPRVTTLLPANTLPNQFAQPYIHHPSRFPVPLPRVVVPPTQGSQENNLAYKIAATKTKDFMDVPGQIPTSHQPETRVDAAASHPDNKLAMGDTKGKTFQDIYIPSVNKTYVHTVQKLRSFRKHKKRNQKTTDISTSSELSSIMKEGNHAECFESELSRLDKQDFSRSLSSKDFTEIDNKSYAYINYNPDLLSIGIAKETNYVTDCKSEPEQKIKTKSIDIQRRKIEKFSTPAANFEKEQISRSFKNMITNCSHSKGSLWDSIGFAELCSPVLKNKVRNTSFSSPHYAGSRYCCCRSCSHTKNHGICRQHQVSLNAAASSQNSDNGIERQLNVEPEMWWDRSTDFGLRRHNEVTWNQVGHRNDNNNNSVVSNPKNDPELSDLEFQPSKLEAKQNLNRNKTYAVESSNNTVRLLTDDNNISNKSSGSTNSADPEEVPGRNSAVKRRLLPVDWAAINTENEEIYQLSHTCDNSLIEQNVKAAKPSIAELDGAIVELGPVSNKCFKENLLPYLLNPSARQIVDDEVFDLNHRSISTKTNQIPESNVPAGHSTNVSLVSQKEVAVSEPERMKCVSDNLQKNIDDCKTVQCADSQQDCRDDTKIKIETNSLKHWKSYPLMNIHFEEAVSSNMNARAYSYKSFFKHRNWQELGGLQSAFKIKEAEQSQGKIEIDSISSMQCMGEIPNSKATDEKIDKKEESYVSPLISSIISSKNCGVSARAVSTGIPKRRSPRILMKSMTSLSLYHKARNNSLSKDESSKSLSRKRKNVVNSSRFSALADIQPDQTNDKAMPNVYNTRNKRFYQTAKPSPTSFFEMAELETARRSFSTAEGSQLLSNKSSQYGFKVYDSYSESTEGAPTPNVSLQSESKTEKIASVSDEKESNDPANLINVNCSEYHQPSKETIEKLSSEEDCGKSNHTKKEFNNKPCPKTSALKDSNKLENDSFPSSTNQNMNVQVNENRILLASQHCTDISTSGQSSFVCRNMSSQDPAMLDSNNIFSKTIQICPSGKTTYHKKLSTGRAMFLQPVINASLSHLPELYLTRMSNCLQMQDANVKHAKFPPPILFNYDKSERSLNHLNKRTRAQVKRRRSIAGTEYSIASHKSQHYPRNSLMQLTSPYLQPVFTKQYQLNALQLVNNEKNTVCQKKTKDPNSTMFRKRLQGIDINAASAKSSIATEMKDNSDHVDDNHKESEQKNEDNESIPVSENVSPTVKPGQSILQQDILCAVETLQFGCNDEAVPVKKAKGNRLKRSFLKRFISITKGKREKKEADVSVTPSDDDPVSNPIRRRRLHIKKRFSSKNYGNAIKNTPSDLIIKKSSETSHSKSKTKNKKHEATISSSAAEERDYNENPTASYTVSQSVTEENITSKTDESCDTIPQNEQSPMQAKATTSSTKRPKEFKTVQNALYKPTFLCMAVTEVPCNNNTDSRKELSLPLSEIEDEKEDVTVSSSVADWFGDDSNASTTTIKRRSARASIGTPGARINSETGDVMDGYDMKSTRSFLSSTTIGDETEAKSKNVPRINKKRFQHVSTLELAIGGKGNVRSKSRLENKEN